MFLLAGGLMAVPAFAPSPDQPRYMQLLAGSLQLSDDSVAVTYD